MSFAPNILPSKVRGPLPSIARVQRQGKITEAAKQWRAPAPHDDGSGQLPPRQAPRTAAKPAGRRGVARGEKELSKASELRLQ